ncbi:MAG: lamin tail domain-containing protein [Candidatus Poribacteria bacterium]|nr:lamin tail domain-containing protein [Candidatus Poribacteria bacterium]
MLSKKMAFSLTSLITIFALAFVVTPVMAQFEIKLSVDSDADVSFADGNQVVYGAAVTLKIMSTKVVNFQATDDATSNTDLGDDDFTVIAYNRLGGQVTTGAPTLGAISIDGTADGMHYMAELTSLAAPAAGTAANVAITRVLIYLPKEKVELADPRAELDGTTRKAAGKNKEASIELHYVAAAQGAAIGTVSGGTFTASAEAGDVGRPIVHSITRVGSQLRPVTSDNFEVLITLSEEPRKDGFKKDHIDAANAAAGDPTFLDKIMQTDLLKSSGRDMMLYRYIVVITPKYENKNDIVVKVKSFYDQEKQSMMMYMPPAANGYTEGMDQLTVKVGQELLKDKAAGVEVVIPKEIRIPASGWTVFAKNEGNSGIINNPGNDKDEPKANERTPAQLKYNLVGLGGLPNLETFLANGGTIDLIGSGLYISEIMWGSDASLDNSHESQWIEIANSGTSSVLTGDKTHKLIFYGPNEPLPDVSTVADRVGTVGTGGYWSIAGKGQSGRSHIEEGDTTGIIGHIPIISMQRLMDTAGSPADGTMATSWVQSAPPAINFKSDIEGVHVATPGAAPITYPAPLVPAPEPAPAPAVPVADAMDIMITEIMVDTGNGRLPQWIELNNVSGAAVSLAGWSVMIENDSADADVIGSDIEIQLMGTLGVSAHAGNMGQGNSLLLVSRAARSSSNLDGNKNIVDVSGAVGARGHYKLISDVAFMITLVPPQKTGVFTPGDMAGNLGASPAWEIPMNEDGRSSLIRHEMDAGVATMGTDANGWVLASGTDLVSGPATWYGSDEDAGTPGYDAGGPLPVELSHFRPARDKATGAVVITWATQSELNNAGFFIKRSNQRDGEFKVINATMIAGAGTTSEKRSYTFTDTTAQPNIVYYYQIEDVSLDGQRQTLTRGIRLKGHIGAAGKLTSTWGELKSSNE